MTTERQMAMAYAAQEEVIVALFVQSVRPIWQPVSNAARQHGGNGTAAMVGRARADPSPVLGVARR